MESINKEIPKCLSTWFVIHFIVDMLFAIPLLFFPEVSLPIFGWKVVDPITSRLVGAALLGIGGESFLGRKASRETFLAMLNLKIIWAAGAIFGLGLSIYQNGPTVVWALLAIFIMFFLIWVYYRLRLKK